MKPAPEWNRDALLRNPLFSPLHPILSRLGEISFPALQDCNDLLEVRQPAITVHSGQTLRFVPQANGKLALEEQYEPRCYLKGEVQTRADNWHDLLNALVWLSFPEAKAAINVRHYQALTEKVDMTTSSQRGAVRDTSTLFDESGVIVACADSGLSALLRNFQWKELFWQRRQHVQRSMGFYLFGHGLYEKSLHPYIGMTGQGLILPVQQEFFSWPLAQQLTHLDDLLAEYLLAPGHCCNTRELTPVPLLGIPGWTEDNGRPDFYDNTRYFRLARGIAESRGCC